MRLGLVIYGSLSTVSGGYLYDQKLVEHLLGKGDEVKIVSIPWRNYLSHLGDNLSPSLQHRLRNLHVDLLLQDELNHPSLFGLNRRLGNGCPVVSIVHHLRCSEYRSVWQNRFYRVVERKYLSTLDGIIYNSHTTQRSVEELVIQDIPSVVAYPAGDRLKSQIGEEDIIHRATHPGPLRLIFLGNVIPRKGLHVLLQALAELPADSLTLSVVGSLDVDLAYTRIIQHLVEENSLSGKVKFCGVLNDDELAACLRDSHILVVPSSYEGFGIAYLEGMGFGLPAIATTRGAAGEIVKSGVNGYLIDPEDSQGLGNHLRQLIKDRQLLVELSLRARQRYLEHPTWDQTGARVRNFLLTFLE